MKIFGWINIAFALLAMASGAIVMRGLLKSTLSSKSTVRFLKFSLIASLAGLLPITRHLAPIQGICMVSVYCSAIAIVAWLKFHLAGHWRPAFALFGTIVLYLNVVSVSIQLFGLDPVAQSLTVFPMVQFFLAAIFTVLAMLAVERCHAVPAPPLQSQKIRPHGVK